MTQCPVCKIVFREGEKALWCENAKSGCPQTQQSSPTYEQMVRLGMTKEQK